MTRTLQITIVIGIGLVLVSAWYFMLGGKALLISSAPETAEGGLKIPSKTESERVPSPPAATGSIDDTVNAILQDVTTDVVSGEDADAALIGTDSQAISDFGQSYGENAF